MARGKIFFLLKFIVLGVVLCQDDMDNMLSKKEENNIVTVKEDILEPTSFVNWPNGTIPFFINSEHFDNEQQMVIMTSLSVIAFKTCLKFAPAMVPPREHEHVLTFQNPRGTHKCEIEMNAHPMTEPHIVTLGYSCLEAPWMDRIVLRALGLPFEHNRQVRDTYIDVQYENIEQHAIPLYTKDISLPAALRALPYDINSVTHFGQRDFTKNGHRTIMFKDRTMKQKWEGLSDLDLRKIEIIYGPECRERDRQEKIELCHMYPGIPPVNRRKRSIDLETTRSLRVNPDITPPPETGLNMSKEVQTTLASLDIAGEVTKIVEDVFRVSSKALAKTREKYCNASKDARRQTETRNDVLGIIEAVANYAQAMVNDAINNLTTFCVQSDSLEKYQRYRCTDGCYKHFYSTKNSQPFYSTRHRPAIPQSTWHVGGVSKPPYDPQYIVYLRARNENSTDKSNETVSEKVLQRRRRQAYDKPKLERRGNYESRGVQKRKRQSKSEEKRRGKYSHEEERYEQKNDRMKRKRIRSSSEWSEERDDSMTNDRRPKMSDRQGKENKRRPDHGLDEKRHHRESTEDESSKSRSDERKNKKTLKRPVHESEERRKKRPEKSTDEPMSSEGSLRTVEMSKQNKEFYEQRRWPGGVVRYVIDTKCTEFSVEDLRRRLAEVNAILRRRTCTRIEELRPGEAKKHEDYLLIDNSPDYVTGRVGGRQVFGAPELLVGGQHRQHAAMIVMAMLGFYFEPSRHDRDEYVKVHQRHIRPDKLHHFEKIGTDATLPLPYDYKSATQPAWMYWRKLGKTGISVVATYKDKDPDGSIMKSFGQHKKLLSEGDIIKINTVYGTKCMQKSG